MKKICVLMALWMILPIQTHATESMRENWTKFQISKKIHQKVKINFKTELRYANPFDHYFNYFDLGASWKIKKWMTVSANFRHITKESGDAWLKEYWPYADLKLAKPIRLFSIANRSRLEIRYREKKDDLYLYRNKVELKFPKCINRKLQPFLADDIFYDLKNTDVYRNRIHIGSRICISQNIGSSISYIFENTWKSNIRSDRNILYLELKYEF